MERTFDWPWAKNATQWSHPGIMDTGNEPDFPPDVVPMHDPIADNITVTQPQPSAYQVSPPVQTVQQAPATPQENLSQTAPPPATPAPTISDKLSNVANSAKEKWPLFLVGAIVVAGLVYLARK